MDPTAIREGKRVSQGRFPLHSTAEPRERALVVGIDRPGSSVSMDSSLEELGRLAHTAGADVVATVTQRLRSPNPATFVGSGKVEEVAQLARAEAVDVIIIDDELTPSQQSNLEKAVDRDIKQLSSLTSSPSMPRAEKASSR